MPLSNQNSGELLQQQSLLKGLPTGEVTGSLPVQQQQQRQLRLPQDPAQQRAASVTQAPVTDSATGKFCHLYDQGFISKCSSPCSSPCHAYICLTFSWLASDQTLPTVLWQLQVQMVQTLRIKRSMVTHLFL